MASCGLHETIAKACGLDDATQRCRILKSNR